MITLDLDPTLEQEINTIADNTGKNAGQLLTEIIKAYFEDQHDIERAEQAIKEINSGESHLLSLTQARQLYDQLAH